MDRRHFIASALTLLVLPAIPSFAASSPSKRTRWNVIESEGYDAIAFLGALSGEDLYLQFYADDVSAFAPGLPADIRADIPRLADEAQKQSFGLLWPTLANILSGASITSLQSVIDALSDLDGRVAPAFRTNPSLEGDAYIWLKGHGARLVAVFTSARAMRFSTAAKRPA